MDKIDFSNPGGIDYTGNDLEFVYNALRKALEGGFSFLKNYNNIILSGCQISEGGGNYTYTEGWVYHDGKLYYVPALTTPNSISLANYIWVFQENKEIVEGTQLCEDGSTAQTWKRSYAQIGRSSGATNLYNADNTFANVVWELIPEEEFRLPSFEHGWGGTFKFKKNRNREIEFNGSASHALINPGQEHITTLPSGYRPSEDKYFKIAGNDGSGNDTIMVRILTNGVVEILTSTFSVNKLVYLHSIRFGV